MSEPTDEQYLADIHRELDRVRAQLAAVEQERDDARAALSALRAECDTVKARCKEIGDEDKQAVAELVAVADRLCDEAICVGKVRVGTVKQLSDLIAKYKPPECTCDPHGVCEAPVDGPPCE